MVTKRNENTKTRMMTNSIIFIFWLSLFIFYLVCILKKMYSSPLKKRNCDIVMETNRKYKMTIDCM